MSGRNSVVANLIIKAIRWYQRVISAKRPACCRYYPTCSRYAIEAVSRYGAFKGGIQPFYVCCAVDHGLAAVLTTYHENIQFFIVAPGLKRMKSHG